MVKASISIVIQEILVQFIPLCSHLILKFIPAEKRHPDHMTSANTLATVVQSDIHPKQVRYNFY